MSSVSKGRKHRARRKTKVVKRDIEMIKQVYKRNAENFEGINYDMEKLGWERIANEFVLRVSSENFRKFVKEVHQEKVQAEKKMKSDLEDRIFRMREAKLKPTLGKDFSRRLKHYIALMKEEHRVEMNSKLAR